MIGLFYFISSFWRRDFPWDESRLVVFTRRLDLRLVYFYFICSLWGRDFPWDESLVVFTARLDLRLVYFILSLQFGEGTFPGTNPLYYLHQDSICDWFILFYLFILGRGLSLGRIPCIIYTKSRFVIGLFYFISSFWGRDFPWDESLVVFTPRVDLRLVNFILSVHFGEGTFPGTNPL